VACGKSSSGPHDHVAPLGKRISSAPDALAACGKPSSGPHDHVLTCGKSFSSAAEHVFTAAGGMARLRQTRAGSVAFDPAEGLGNGSSVQVAHEPACGCEYSQGIISEPFTHGWMRELGVFYHAPHGNVEIFLFALNAAVIRVGKPACAFHSQRE
jgi:hypothetical protein